MAECLPTRLKEVNARRLGQLRSAVPERVAQAGDPGDARNSRRFAFQLAEQARGRDHDPRDESGHAAKQQDLFQDSDHRSLHNVDVLVMPETSASCRSARRKAGRVISLFF
jgi:hypothetical protein